MRFAIFGDIHANLEALETVLADARAKTVAAIFVCLGDVVGYNANPHECLEIVRGLECPGGEGQSRRTGGHHRIARRFQSAGRRGA